MTVPFWRAGPPENDHGEWLRSTRAVRRHLDALAQVVRAHDLVGPADSRRQPLTSDPRHHREAQRPRSRQRRYRGL